MRRFIRVLFVAPLCDPAELYIDGDDFRQMQALVGGSMDGRALGNQLSMYVHDEGILIGLPPNLRTPKGDMIAGNVFISRYNEPGDQIDLTDDDVAHVRRWVATCARPAKFEYSPPEHLMAAGDNMENVRAEIAAKQAILPPIVVRGIALTDPFDPRSQDPRSRNGGGDGE